MAAAPNRPVPQTLSRRSQAQLRQSMARSHGTAAMACRSIRPTQLSTRLVMDIPYVAGRDIVAFRSRKDVLARSERRRSINES